jgi:hypothetical protein
MLGLLRSLGTRLLSLPLTLASLVPGRWRLMAENLPLVLLSLALRLLVELLGLGVISADTVGAFSNSAIFVIALMVSGVVSSSACAACAAA